MAEFERDRMSDLLISITAAVPDCVYANNITKRFFVGNNGLTELLGCASDHDIGKAEFEILNDKSEANRVVATDSRVIGNGQSQQVR